MIEPHKVNKRPLYKVFILHFILHILYYNLFTLITARPGYLCCFQRLLLFKCLINQRLEIKRMIVKAIMNGESLNLYAH